MKSHVETENYSVTYVLWMHHLIQSSVPLNFC